MFRTYKDEDGSDESDGDADKEPAEKKQKGADEEAENGIVDPGMWMCKGNAA